MPDRARWTILLVVTCGALAPHSTLAQNFDDDAHAANQLDGPRFDAPWSDDFGPRVDPQFGSPESWAPSNESWPRSPQFSDDCAHCGRRHPPNRASGHGPAPIPPWLAWLQWRLCDAQPGEPLVGESWLKRPFGASFLVGGIWGDDLITGEVEQNSGLLGDFRLSWDFGPQWGSEMQLAVASPRLDYPTLTPQNAASVRRDAKFTFWNVSLLYFPWGENRWRPYFRAGLGLVDIDFQDALGRVSDDTLFGIPLGFGVKYRLGRKTALRLELADQIAIGGSNRLETVHNLTLSGGMEIRFGGARQSYWPWSPNVAF